MCLRTERPFLLQCERPILRVKVALEGEDMLDLALALIVGFFEQEAVIFDLGIGWADEKGEQQER